MLNVKLLLNLITGISLSLFFTNCAEENHNVRGKGEGSSPVEESQSASVDNLEASRTENKTNEEGEELTEAEYLTAEFDSLEEIDVDTEDYGVAAFARSQSRDDDWKLDLSGLERNDVARNFDASITPFVCTQEEVGRCLITAYEELIVDRTFKKKIKLIGSYGHLVIINQDNKIQKIKLKDLFTPTSECRMRRHIDSIATSALYGNLLLTVGDCYAEVRGTDFANILEAVKSGHDIKTILDNGHKLILKPTAGKYNNQFSSDDANVCDGNRCKISFATSLDYNHNLSLAGPEYTNLLGSMATKSFLTVFYSDYPVAGEIIDAKPIKAEFVSNQICKVLNKAGNRQKCKLIAMSVAQETDYRGKHYQSYIIQYGFTSFPDTSTRFPYLIKVDLVNNKFVNPTHR